MHTTLKNPSRNSTKVILHAITYTYHNHNDKIIEIQWKKDLKRIDLETCKNLHHNPMPNKENLEPIQSSFSLDGN